MNVVFISSAYSIEPGVGIIRNMINVMKCYVRRKNGIYFVNQFGVILSEYRVSGVEMGNVVDGMNSCICSSCSCNPGLIAKIN